MNDQKEVVNLSPRLAVIEKHFKIEKYSICDEFTLVDWANELRSRWAQFSLGYRLNSPSTDDPYEQGTRAVERILIAPVRHHGTNLMMGGYGQKSVFEPSIIDLFHLWDYAKDFPGAAEKWDELCNWELEDGPLKITKPLERNYHSAGLEDNLRLPWSAHNVCVELDLRATDEQITAEFSAYLKTKRDELASYKEAIPPVRKIDKGDVKKWCELQVLAYLDIVYLEHYFELQIPNHRKGQMLFPDEYDVDLGERVRKVVKPLADKMLSVDALETLTRAAQGSPV